MRLGRFWTLMLLAGLFALGMAWQSSRFTDLKSRARELEAEQETWIAENRKIEAEIALLSSRERTEAMATRLGLKKALPEEKLRILLAPAEKNSAASLGSQGIPLSSAQKAGSKSHD
ncbi:MAG: cell division protein FtsL [Rectinemataceae bacterium]